jgi:hypothetical protein
MLEVKDWYLGLPNSEKQRFLATVGRDLTVQFRGYKPGAALNPKSWFGVNEMHHQIYDAIIAMAEIKHYDPNISWDHLFFLAREYNLTGTLTSALNGAKDAMTRADAMVQ